MIALRVKLFREGQTHLTPVRRPRYAARMGSARVDRNDGRADAEFFAAQFVKRFGIVRGVGEHAAGPKTLSGLPDRGRKESRVVARAASQHDAGDDMGAIVADEGGLNPGPMGLAASGLALKKVAADVVGIPAGAVERGRGACRQEGVRALDLAV